MYKTIYQPMLHKSMFLHYSSHKQFVHEIINNIYLSLSLKRQNSKTKYINLSTSSSLQSSTMKTQDQNLHFVMLPFMAPGHLIPMVDLSRLLAERSLRITILTTPHNYDRFKPIYLRVKESGLDIHIFLLKFPYAEAGLPEGYENFDMLSSSRMDAMKFFIATALLKDQVLEFLKETTPIPSCLIADMCFPWATKVAVEMHIPRILFHGTSCFSLLCMHVLGGDSKDLDGILSESEHFVVPGLPDRIEMTKAQIRGLRPGGNDGFDKFWEELRAAEVEAFGTVANTFEELEPEYVKEYKKVKAKKAWCVGPVSLCNENELDKAERGSKATIDVNECLEWLGSHEQSSVIYVCLGSLSKLPTLQLIELGLGLEASNRPFIWVIRNVSDEFKTWLLEAEFEERINGRGILIHGWAPQVLILSHASVGGFLTHCGWNSTLEGMAAGIPMITWPLFAEQFCNEKFIVNVVKTGVRVGVEEAVIFGEGNVRGLLIKSDEVNQVVERLMDGGEEGEERRKRARELGEKAKRALEEGGSSYLNMTLLIQDVAMKRDSYVESSANDIALVLQDNCDDAVIVQ